MTTTYLDRLQGIETSVAVKAPVLVATTAAITLSGEQTIDGVALVAGDRVLVKDQASAIDNGIWDVSTGTWSRADDFNGVRDAVRGTRVFVVAGSTNSNTEWVLTTTDPEIGVTSLAFTANGFSTTGLFETLSPSGGDDASALQTLNDSAKIQFMFGGAYTAGSSLTDQARPKILFADDATIGGDTIPMLSLSKYSPDKLPRSMLFVSQDTSQRDDTATVFFQRVVNTDHGLSNPKLLKAATTVQIDTSQIEYAISGEMTSYSDSGTNSHTAVSGTSFKYGLAGLFGGHFQANEMFKHTSATAVTALVGAEVNTPAVGLDHPSANSGYGLRYCLDVIARTNESVANWDVDEGDNYGDAEIGTGISIRTDNISDGYFRFGIAIREDASNANSIGTGIRINTTGSYGIHASGANSTAHYYSSGSPAYGAVFAGTYGTAAIRLNSQQAMAMEGTGSIKTAYGVTSNIWGFYSGANERVGFNMTATPSVRIAGTAVLGARKTGWAVPTGTATRTTFDTASVTLPQLAERVKGLIEDLHSTAGHGLIGA